MVATVEQSKVEIVTSSSTPSISFASTPTSGNILFAVLMSQGDATPITAPTGWTLEKSGNSGTNITTALAYKVSDGTEGAVQWTKTTSNHNSLWLAEVSGLSGSTPLTSGIETDAGVSVTSRTITNDASTDADDYCIAVNGAQAATNSDGGRTWSDGFSEIDIVPLPTTRPLLSVASKVLTATGIVSTTYATTDSGDQMAGVIIAWAVAGGAPAGIEVLRRRINGEA